MINEDPVISKFFASFAVERQSIPVLIFLSRAPDPRFWMSFSPNHGRELQIPPNFPAPAFPCNLADPPVWEQCEATLTLPRSGTGRYESMIQEASPFKEPS